MLHLRYQHDFVHSETFLVAFRDELFKEMWAMQQIGHHQRIVSLFGVTCVDDIPVLVLEYCMNGDLLSFLRTPKARSMTPFMVFWMCLEICEGMVGAY